MDVFLWFGRELPWRHIEKEDSLLFHYPDYGEQFWKCLQEYFGLSNLILVKAIYAKSEKRRKRYKGKSWNTNTLEASF